MRELGIEDIVIFTGFRRDIADLMAAADLLVLPSLAEAFGLALTEAMYLGTPVVASRVGGIPEIVRDGVDGLLVPPGSPGRHDRSPGPPDPRPGAPPFAGEKALGNGSATASSSRRWCVGTRKSMTSFWNRSGSFIRRSRPKVGRESVEKVTGPNPPTQSLQPRTLPAARGSRRSGRPRTAVPPSHCRKSNRFHAQVLRCRSFRSSFPPTTRRSMSRPPWTASSNSPSPTLKFW